MTTTQPTLLLDDPADAAATPRGAGLIAMPEPGRPREPSRPTRWEDTDAAEYPGLYSLARDYLVVRDFLAAFAPDRPGYGLVRRAEARLRGALELLLSLPGYPATATVGLRRLRSSCGALVVATIGRQPGAAGDPPAKGRARPDPDLPPDFGSLASWREADRRWRGRLPESRRALRATRATSNA